MTSNKKKSIENSGQLLLPLGDHSDKNLSAQKGTVNIIHFSQHYEQKKYATKIKERKNIAKKLVDYADSLDW